MNIQARNSSDRALIRSPYVTQTRAFLRTQATRELDFSCYMITQLLKINLLFRILVVFDLCPIEFQIESELLIRLLSLAVM